VLERGKKMLCFRDSLVVARSYESLDAANVALAIEETASIIALHSWLP